MGGGDRRQMYLTSLKSLVPSLSHAPEPTPNQSGHFSFLEKKAQPNTMPFLQEVFEVTANRAKISSENRKYMVNKVQRYYPTTEPAQSVLLAPRYIPPEIMKYIPDNKLKEKGCTGRSARLSPDCSEGAREQAAIDSYDQATSYMRLSNNIEIGVEVANTLSTRLKEQVSKVGEADLSPETALLLSQMKTNIDLLGQTINDIKSSNNDLLKTAVDQYHLSLVSRRDSWLTASTLPKGLKNEVKATEIAIPSPYDPVDEKLCLFGNEGVQTIKEHFQTEKDKAIMGAHNQYSGPNRYRGRGRGQSHPRPHTQSNASDRRQTYNQPNNQSHRSPRKPRDDRDPYKAPRGQPSFRRSSRGRRY